MGQVVSGRYRIEKLLGEGGMGAVYLAEHTLMRKRVALKLLHAEIAADPDILARFRREAEAAAHVEHPNVAAATDFGQTEDGAFFLVLEYVEGKSLRTEIEAGALAPARALHIARQMALALERAHAAGIVHRDLKPDNVMLVQKADDPDFVKVLDFGIAKIEPHPTRDVAQPLTRLGTILGTPEYMAPEQALGEAVGPGADLYALGIMLYEMLTGLHPFDAPDRMAVLSMHIVAPVPAMTDRNPAFDVAPAIEDVVRRLLAKTPAERPASARLLVEAIDTAAAASGVELPQSSMRFGRESNPGPPPSTREVAPPSTRDWRANDALAKTDHGLPASTAKLPAAVQTFHGSSARSRKPSALVIKVGSALLALLLLGFAIVAGVSGRRGGAGADAGAAASVAAPPRTSATPGEIRAAATGGPGALTDLAARFPDDVAVQKALAGAHADGGRIPDALRAIRIWVKLDPNAVDDATVQLVVTAAARADTADDAFSLLEGPLGTRGVDALVDLAGTKSVPAATRLRATKAIARPEVRAGASPATSVFLELRAATTCPAKRDLLERVKENGDERTLPALKQLRSPRGCGFMGMRDCWACLRKGDGLDEAIRAVEGRK